MIRNTIQIWQKHTEEADVYEERTLRTLCLPLLLVFCAILVPTRGN